MTENEDELLKHERRALCLIHSKRLDKIDRTLNGNGDPKTGIVWKIEQNTDFINSIKKHWGWMIRLALGGALSAIAMFAFQILKLLVQGGRI